MRTARMARDSGVWHVTRRVDGKHAFTTQHATKTGARIAVWLWRVAASQRKQA